MLYLTGCDTPPPNNKENHNLSLASFVHVHVCVWRVCKKREITFYTCMTITIGQQAIRILVVSYLGMGNGMACARPLIK